MNLRRFFAAFLILVFSSSSLISQEMRTWTDSTGSFNLEASFVATNGKQVKLKNADGKVLTLALDKLSQEDQDYVNDQADADDANPFAAAARAAESGGSSENAGGGGSGSRTVKIDLENAVEMGDYGDTEWSCEPDPSPIPKYPGKPRRLNFRLGNTPIGVHPKESDLFFSPKDGQTVHTAVTLGSSGDRDGWKNVTRLFFGDVSTGKTHSIDHPLSLTAFGFAPDGKKLLFRQGSWESGIDWGKRGKLFIVSYEDGKITPMYSFEPFAQYPSRGYGSTKEKDVEWATWVDDDHILVISGDDQLVLIDYKAGKAVWTMKTSAEKLTLSPGKKYCIVPTKNQDTLFIETLTGETLGNFEGLSRTFIRSHFAFSPDGKKIAMCENDSVRIWEANTGKAYEPFFIRGANTFTDIIWTSNRSILAGNVLVDPVNKVPVWQYNHLGAKGLTNVGGCVWYMNSKHREGYIVNAVVLPHAKVKPADGVSDSDIYNVYPGLDVSLVLDGSISKNREEIGKIVSAKLKNNGLNVKNGAPITVTLKQSKEPEQKATYVVGGRFMPMFNRGGGTEVSYRPDKYTIQIQKQNKTLWEETRITSPPNLEIDDVNKNSLQAAVNKEMEKFNYKDWVDRVVIPKKILDPMKIGLSTLGEDGIRDLDRQELERFRQRMGR